MDVLLARDRYLLRLVFKELDVIVDVEDVFVELGEVMELWSVDERRVLVLLQMTKKKPSGIRHEFVSHLLSDGELQAFHPLLFFQVMKVLV